MRNHRVRVACLVRCSAGRGIVSVLAVSTDKKVVSGARNVRGPRRLPVHAAAVPAGGGHLAVGHDQSPSASRAQVLQRLPNSDSRLAVVRPAGTDMRADQSGRAEFGDRPGDADHLRPLQDGVLHRPPRGRAAHGGQNEHDVRGALVRRHGNHAALVAQQQAALPVLHGVGVCRLRRLGAVADYRRVHGLQKRRRVWKHNAAQVQVPPQLLVSVRRGPVAGVRGRVRVGSDHAVRRHSSVYRDGLLLLRYRVHRLRTAADTERVSEAFARARPQRLHSARTPCEKSRHNRSVCTIVDAI